jgi:hypothetical protein
MGSRVFQIVSRKAQGGKLQPETTLNAVVGTTHSKYLKQMEMV